MNRIVKQFLIGTTPLWIGMLLNAVLNLIPLPIFFVSLAFLIFWTWMCYKCCVRWESIWQQAAILSGFGTLMLLFVLFQELVLHRYWVSYFGIATQMYFLPGLGFFAVLISRILPVTTPWNVYIVELIGLFLCALLGCRLKTRKKA